MDEFLERIDWQSLAEFIEPAIGLIMVLLFMGFVRLMRAARGRRSSTESRRSTVPASLPEASTVSVSRKVAAQAAPIEPGDDAAKLSERYSQQASPR